MKTTRIRRGIGALVLALTAGVLAACTVDNPTAPDHPPEDEPGPTCYVIDGSTFCDPN